MARELPPSVAETMKDAVAIVETPVGHTATPYRFYVETPVAATVRVVGAGRSGAAIASFLFLATARVPAAILSPIEIIAAAVQTAWIITRDADMAIDGSSVRDPRVVAGVTLAAGATSDYQRAAHHHPHWKTAPIV